MKGQFDSLNCPFSIDNETPKLHNRFEILFQFEVWYGRV